MKTKMVSCLVCVYENDIISSEFFNDLEVAYSELDRQVQDEASKLAAEGCGPDGVTIFNAGDSTRIVWQRSRAAVLAENPEFTEAQLAEACKPHETIFSVLTGPIR